MDKDKLKVLIKECFLDVLVEKRCWKGYEPVPGKKPYEKGSCRKKRSNISEESNQKTFDNKKDAILYLKSNPLSSVSWQNKTAIYWNGKIRIFNSGDEMIATNIGKNKELSEGGKCSKPNTKKASSTRKDKKWMKCSNGKRIHWGDPNAKVTGKSGNTKRKKNFRARHKCSTAKVGTARHAACSDW